MDLFFYPLFPPFLPPRTSPLTRVSMNGVCDGSFSEGDGDKERALLTIRTKPAGKIAQDAAYRRKYDPIDQGERVFFFFFFRIFIVVVFCFFSILVFPYFHVVFSFSYFRIFRDFLLNDTRYVWHLYSYGTYYTYFCVINSVYISIYLAYICEYA